MKKSIAIFFLWLPATLFAQQSKEWENQMDSLARMGRLGRGEVVTGRLRSMDENLRRLGGVTAEEVRSLAAWLVAQDRARVLVGPVAANLGP